MSGAKREQPGKESEGAAFQCSAGRERGAPGLSSYNMDQQSPGMSWDLQCDHNVFGDEEVGVQLQPLRRATGHP